MMTTMMTGVRGTVIITTGILAMTMMTGVRGIVGTLAAAAMMMTMIVRATGAAMTMTIVRATGAAMMMTRTLLIRSAGATRKKKLKLKLAIKIKTAPENLRIAVS